MISCLEALQVGCEGILNNVEFARTFGEDQVIELQAPQLGTTDAAEDVRLLVNHLGIRK